MGKRLQGIVIGLVVGIIAAGGVAYSVTDAPPSPGDQFYACVKPDGAVEHRTLRFNRPPSASACSDPADIIRSWNATGPLATSALYSAASMNATTSGCPSGQVQGRFGRRWGTPMSWELSGCRAPTVETITTVTPVQYKATVRLTYRLVDALPFGGFVAPQGWNGSPPDWQYQLAVPLIPRSTFVCSASAATTVSVSCSIQSIGDSSAAAVADLIASVPRVFTYPVEIRKVT